MTAQILDRVVLQPGEFLFKEGEPGERAYVIQEGKIDILKSTTDGEVVLGTIEKGGIFGEMALIDNQPRMASAVAASTCTVIVINRDTFQRKLSKCDPFVRGLLGIFVKNIRSMVEEHIN
jgi:CRP-like cAMP-binding protein